MSTILHPRKLQSQERKHIHVDEECLFILLYAFFGEVP